MKNYLTEFIGTFFLVLTIGLTVTGETPFAPLAIGSVLMVMVYMGGHISGAHYNPAITIAITLLGKMDKKEVLPYWISQILGGIAAALVTYYVAGEALVVAPSASASMGAILLVEILFTFALALVIMNVAACRETAGNSYYGLAIGFTVAAGAFAGGSISGGAFNPAVGIGPILVDGIMGDGGFSNIWIYIVAPIIGAAIAPFAFKMQNPQDALID